MGTSFSEVFEMFMSKVDDYRLITLFETSIESFEAYLTAWLIPSIEDFKKVCDQDLSYVLLTKKFNFVLTNKNINILSQIMKKYWMNRLVDDISQTSLHIQGDFKTYSEAQGYKVKQDRLNNFREEISQLLVDYSLEKQSCWDALMAING